MAQTSISRQNRQPAGGIHTFALGKLGNRYFGGLILVAAITPLPFLAALITIIIYLSPSPLPAEAFFNWLGPSNRVILLGLIITLVLWFLLGIPCSYFATAKRGRPSDYESLDMAVQDLKNRLEVVKEENKVTQDNDLEHKQAREIARLDVETNVRCIEKSLKHDGSHWLSTGYLSLWARINEADEAIVDILPYESVIESAKYEELRLKNSQITDNPDSAELSESLKAAIDILSLDPNCPKSLSKQNEARANIRKVKAALHRFTSERWDGLIRARNQLVATAFLTAFITYVLVLIAILANVPSRNTLNAMVFYFLGAIVGLFGRLLDERNADTAVEDYGLSMTRILIIPLISGLAALVGVLFVTTSPATDLIYQMSIQNLVFAALLGLAPNILVGMLQSQSEAIKGQIKSTSATDGVYGAKGSGQKGNAVIQ